MDPEKLPFRLDDLLHLLYADIFPSIPVDHRCLWI
ncbi:hypothetical protein ES705_02059 [subsurface metagenome]